MTPEQTSEQTGLPAQQPLREGHPAHPQTDPLTVEQGAQAFDAAMERYADRLRQVFDALLLKGQ